jgi:ribosomal-protein-alanine N-acetyltransferase
MLPVLTTPRLVLRPARPDDTEAVWRLLVLPDVRRFLCDDKVLGREVVAGIVAEHLAAVPQGMGMWIAEREGAMLGIVSLKAVPQVLADLIPELEGEAEPTVALHPDGWGQGLAGEALGAVLGHGFGALALPRIAAICDVPNLASAAMLARAGFRRTGEHPGLHYRLFSWMLERP